MVRKNVKKKLLTKRAINNLHFKRRLKERYGIIINSKNVMKLAIDVQCGKARHLEKLSLSRDLYKLNYLNKQIYAVYDHNHKNFVTALPFDKLEEKYNI